MEHEGQNYELVRGSDVVNDGMFLEAWNKEELILLAFWSDADGSFTFTAFKEKLPIAVIEQFIQAARQGLPSINDGQKGS